MSFRTTMIALALLLLLTAGGFLAFRSSWVKSLFVGDKENVQELARLSTASFASREIAAEAGWPQWRGPLRDGRAACEIRTDWDDHPLKSVWSAACGGGYSSFAVIGGKLYTQDYSSGQEGVICLNAETGKLLWEYRYPADYKAMTAGYATGPRATPTVVGDRVYTVGATGKFLCLEAPKPGAKPRVVWEHDLLAEFDAAIPQWGVACSPLVEGDAVIVQPGGKKGSVAAFDCGSGEVKWKAGSNPSGYSSPIAATIGELRVIYAFTGNSLLCIRAADGTLLAEYPWKTDFNANIATPIPVDDYVFISSAYNKGCALLRTVVNGDEARFEEVYFRSNAGIRAHHSSPIHLDGHIYGYDGTRSTSLRCLDLRNGQVVLHWNDIYEFRSGTLIAAGKNLILFTEKGELALVQAWPQEFKVLAEGRPSGLKGSELWALPALADGRLYLRGNRQILCLDLQLKKK